MTLSKGGSGPPNEPERTLDEMLDNDVRDAIDQVEEVEEEAEDIWIVKFLKNFGEQLAIAAMIAAIFFAVGLWWNSGIEAKAGESTTPEVTIGVDPNGDAELRNK